MSKQDTGFIPVDGILTLTLRKPGSYPCYQYLLFERESFTDVRSL